MARVLSASLPLAIIAVIAFASVSVRADECDEFMTGFHDNDMKSQAWQDIAHGNVNAVVSAINEDNCYAKMRAADGRGPLFWAHEFYNQKIIDALVAAGADMKAKDKGGKTPVQMPRAPAMNFEAPSDEDEEEYEPDDDDELRVADDVDDNVCDGKTIQRVPYRRYVPKHSDL